MSVLRVVGWTLLAGVAGIVIFLAATIRVVEPHPEAPDAPAPPQRAASSRFLLPVEGVEYRSLRSNWGEVRGGGTRAHQALDIMAPAGAPVVAATDGIVEKLYFSKGGGGIALYQRAASGDLMLYYAHLRAYAVGMAEGRRVRAGETIGYVGDTGNAGAGNYHLHFAVARMAPGERWWQGTPIDPYPLLAGARKGG
jgi:murein DD-endopeptidase MepM/ murein hydrolase activator NlpD